MSKKLGPIAVFLVTACLSFFITQMLIKENTGQPLSDSHVQIAEESGTDIPTDVSSGGETITTPATDTTPTTDYGTTPKPAKLMASKRILEENTYSFKAYIDGTLEESYHFELKEDGALVSESNDGSFSNIPPSPRYKLHVVGENGKDLAKSISITDCKDPSAPELTKPIKLRVSKRDVENNKYSFTAFVDGTPTEAYHFELTKDGTVVSKSNDGSFSDIPPSPKYELHIVSESGDDLAKSISITDCKDKSGPKLITKEEFQTRMLNLQDHSLDGGRNKKKTFVTDDFKVVVINTNKEIDGEYEVSDVQDVKGMIHTYNKWKGARVVELEYDAKGYVKLAKIEAIY